MTTTWKTYINNKKVVTVNYLIDEFCNFAYNHQDTRLDVLLNAFIKSKSGNEKNWIIKNYIMFIRCAESYSKATGNIRKHISV